MVFSCFNESFSNLFSMVYISTADKYYTNNNVLCVRIYSMYKVPNIQSVFLGWLPSKYDSLISGSLSSRSIKNAGIFNHCYEILTLSDCSMMTPEEQKLSSAIFHSNSSVKASAATVSSDQVSCCVHIAKRVQGAIKSHLFM